ncbi:hypothetical protein L916_15498 [Phytophthora nicotianae]|uniref:Uncharacterized protein n=1 Tax=Phytophthora nicotianae TaxID=4792 RepID=W2ICH1_PHYNI|nr:hypothetical protein L916_15498 [Phytophthora nicotianae]
MAGCNHMMLVNFTVALDCIAWARLVFQTTTHYTRLKSLQNL